MTQPARSDGACSQLMRLQRYLARSGVASRRHAEDLIRDKRVSVNGEIAQLGMSVFLGEDDVRFDGESIVLAEDTVTLMLHKPCGYLSSMSEEQGRSVAELVPVDTYPSLFHIGRLDKDTSGLLLFSNEGTLAHGLLHPSREIDKVYLAQVTDIPSDDALQALRDGVLLEDGMTAPATVAVVTGDDAARAEETLRTGQQGAARHGGKKAYAQAHAETTIIRITIHEGRTRQVRRMFESIGHPVVALHRERFGPLELGSLPCGAWRELTEEEVAACRSVAVI